MVLDTLEKIDMYEGLHPSFSKVIAYLKDLDFNSLQRGKIVVDDDFYINVDEADLKDAQSASLEVHNAYIDIQIPITGSEKMGWRSRSTCKNVHKPYDAAVDMALYNEQPTTMTLVQPGEFTVFFPEDGHQPGIAPTTAHYRKIIVKTRV